VPGDLIAAMGVVSLSLEDDTMSAATRNKDELMSLCGSIKPRVRGVTVEDMNEAIREAASGEP